MKRRIWRGWALALFAVGLMLLTAASAVAEVTPEDLQGVYDEYCDSAWAKMSADGTSLSVDTNPSDVDDYIDYEAYLAIEDINEALGLPDSVYTRMGHTTSMQGVQTATSENLTVTWAYHPDNGMEIVYSIESAEAREHTPEELQGVYDEYCDSSWAKISADGTSLSVDTNPSDVDDYIDYEAYLAIEQINEALGLPDSVYTRMGHTTSMQGVQTATSGNLTVTWSYHPDNGMEIVYSID